MDSRAHHQHRACARRHTARRARSHAHRRRRLPQRTHPPRRHRRRPTTATSRKLRRHTANRPPSQPHCGVATRMATGDLDANTTTTGGRVGNVAARTHRPHAVWTRHAIAARHARSVRGRAIQHRPPSQPTRLGPTRTPHPHPKESTRVQPKRPRATPETRCPRGR